MAVPRGIFRAGSTDCILTGDHRSGSIFNQLHMVAMLVTRCDHHDMAPIAFAYLVVLSAMFFGGSGQAC